MRKHVITIFWIVCMVAVPYPALATPVGFVDGLWFSTESFTADEPVRIYAAIRNHSGHDISGRVSFYINDRRVKTQPVAALNNRVIEAWTDWTPTAGTHTVRATFANIQQETIATDPEPLPDATELSRTITVAPPVPKPPDEPPSATSSPATSTATGLERYLAPSPARSILTRITEWSSSTRQALAERSRNREPDTIDVATVSSTVASVSTTDATTSTPAEQSFVHDLSAVSKNLFDTVKAGVLTIMIGTFARPALIQLLLLLILLFGIYRTARFFGRRR